MVPHLVGIFAASIVAYLIRWLVGDHVGMMTEFLLTVLVGGPVYVFSVYKLKQMHGDF